MHTSYFERPPLEAAGNILPYRFIALSNDFTATQAGNASTLVMGVAKEGGREATIPSVSTVYAAIAADQFDYYRLGEVCYLQVAAATNAGTKLAPDANGKGRAAVSTELAYALQLEDAANADEYVRVLLFGAGQYVA